MFLTDITHPHIWILITKPLSLSLSLSVKKTFDNHSKITLYVIIFSKYWSMAYLALILRSQTQLWLEGRLGCIRGKKCKFLCCTHTEDITQLCTTTKYLTWCEILVWHIFRRYELDNIYSKCWWKEVEFYGVKNYHGANTTY